MWICRPITNHSCFFLQVKEEAGFDCQPITLLLIQEQGPQWIRFIFLAKITGQRSLGHHKLSFCQIHDHVLFVSLTLCDLFKCDMENVFMSICKSLFYSFFFSSLSPSVFICLGLCIFPPLGGSLKTPDEADKESLQATWWDRVSPLQLRGRDILELIDSGLKYGLQCVLVPYPPIDVVDSVVVC